MIININIDIELSQEEINLLRKYFNNGITSKQFWAPRLNLSVYSEEIVKEYNIVESLLNKEVFKKDMMNNYTLTTIGNIIVDKIDRDKIINNIMEKRMVPLISSARMNKCSCNKIQQPGEIWMQGLCNRCGSEIGACSWNCSLEICQNCMRDLRISEILDLGEMGIENIGILKNSEIL